MVGRHCQSLRSWNFNRIKEAVSCDLIIPLLTKVVLDMQDYYIPIKIQGDLQSRADAYLSLMLPKVSWRMFADCRGKFVYIRRGMPDQTWHNLGRMIYDGDENTMSFALFRWSTEEYDVKADFSGAQHLDGTIEGAIKAILAVYP
jgi:hypothetical protein